MIFLSYVAKPATLHSRFILSPKFLESKLQFLHKRFCHHPVDVIPIAVLVVEGQVIRKLEDLEILLGKDRAPGAYVGHHIREFG